MVPLGAKLCAVPSWPCLLRMLLHTLVFNLDQECPIPGDVQGQLGQGFEQPDLVEDGPVHGMGVGLDDLQKSLL